MGEKSTSTLSRRRLLKRAANAGVVLATAPMFIPASALGKDGAIPPSERITFAGSQRFTLMPNACTTPSALRSETTRCQRSSAAHSSFHA